MTDKRSGVTRAGASAPSLSAELYQSIRQLLLGARNQVRLAVNTAMVQTYWHIGQKIVEDEQGGQRRAAYGKQVLSELAQRLGDEFGAGFDVSNLRNMRRFYLAFPIRETLSPELSWSAYLSLMRVENPQARDWYAKEAAEQGWSVLALDRQIGTLYYERLLSTRDLSKATVKREAAQHIAKDAPTDPRDFIRYPYVLEFLSATPLWPSIPCWPTSPNSLPANTRHSCPPKPNCKPSWSATVLCWN